MSMINKINTNFWDNIASSYHKFSSFSVTHLDKYNTVADLIITNGAKHILDAGCGSGILAQKLLEKGYTGKITGIDSSKEMINIANENLKNNKNTNFALLDINNQLPLPYASNTFDLVVSINMFFLLKDPSNFLEEVSRLIKPGGLFILINPKPKGSFVNFFVTQFENISIKKMFYNIGFILFNMPYLIKLIFGEKKINKLVGQGQINYQRAEEIETALLKVGFKIKSITTVQGNQNWFFLCSR